MAAQKASKRKVRAFTETGVPGFVDPVLVKVGPAGKFSENQPP
jgi:hypothetical protein